MQNKFITNNYCCKIIKKRLGNLRMFNIKQKRTKSSHMLTINEHKIPFTLISSNLAKNISFKIGINTGLEIVVPGRFNREELPRIIKNKKGWILKNYKQTQKKLSQKPKFQNGAVINILGEGKVLHLCRRKKNRSEIKETPCDIFLYCNGMLSDAKETFKKYLRKKAKEYFTIRTDEISRQMGTKFNKITIRGQKSRWGSCSKNKNLNFNWRLMLTNPQIVDFIIIHELAHTVHMNHSKSFYRLVEAHCPDHKKLNKALKEHSFVT
jgi:predicted metal-dependent hydrolase